MSIKRSLLHHCNHRYHRTHHRPATSLVSNWRNAAHQTRSIIGTPSPSNSTTTHRHTHKSILHRIHPQNLYQIINDVDQYQHFLPYCHESKIMQTSPCGTMYDAVLRVGLPGLSNLLPKSLLEERYISRVRKIPPSPAAADDITNAPMSWTVEAKSIQSQLFDSLKSRWKLELTKNTQRGHNCDDNGSITTNGASCSVNFDIEIQVSNPLVALTLDQVLKDVARKQVEAFERRCNGISMTHKDRDQSLLMN